MYRYLLFFLVNLLSLPLAADFINTLNVEDCESILEVYIEKQEITVKLEIGAKDYPWFSDIIPERFFTQGYMKEKQSSHLDRFIASRFLMKTEGRPLTGKVRLVELRPETLHDDLLEQKPDTTSARDTVLYVEIVYPTSKSISSLSITPPMESGQDVSPANICLVAYHKSIPINDLNMLLKEEVLYLDWVDPWYSYFENKNISRHHSSSFMSFLYVEPYEVRHEILCRVKDLEDWLDLGYEMGDMINEGEIDTVKSRISQFLVEKNIVEIDGEKIRPIVDKVHFVEVNLAGIQVMEIPKPIPYTGAIIGIIFAYPHESMPKEVTMQWDLFNDKIQRIPCLSIDPAGPWPYDLEPSENVLKWTNFLKHYRIPTISEQKVEEASLAVPIFSVICLLMLLFVLFRNGWTLNGLSKWRKFFFALYILLGVLSFPVVYEIKVPFVEKKVYSVPEASELVSQLLKNIYRAFDFRDEEDVYDKLALSTTDKLLQQIYLQTRSGLLIENQGGMEVNVDEVVIMNVSQIEKSAEGLSLRCNWIIKGEVGHWGHKHQRVNQYDAIMNIISTDGSWKINELEMINEVRM
jgi:hypothetical protein